MGRPAERSSECIPTKGPERRVVGGPLGGSVRSPLEPSMGSSVGSSVGSLVRACGGVSGVDSFGASLRVLDLSMCGPEEMQIEGTLPLDIGDQCPLLEQVRRGEETKRAQPMYYLFMCLAVLLFPIGSLFVHMGFCGDLFSFLLVLVRVTVTCLLLLTVFVLEYVWYLVFDC